MSFEAGFRGEELCVLARLPRLLVPETCLGDDPGAVVGRSLVSLDRAEVLLVSSPSGPPPVGELAGGGPEALGASTVTSPAGTARSLTVELRSPGQRWVTEVRAAGAPAPGVRVERQSVRSLEVPYDGAAAPSWVRDRVALPSCGTALVDGDGAPERARTCLRRAADAGIGAELVVGALGAEGDVSVVYERVLPDGSYEELYDATRDGFGSEEWSRTTCAEVGAEGCGPRP